MCGGGGGKVNTPTFYRFKLVTEREWKKILKYTSECTPFSAQTDNLQTLLVLGIDVFCTRVIDCGPNKLILAKTGRAGVMKEPFERTRTTLFWLKWLK